MIASKQKVYLLVISLFLLTHPLAGYTAVLEVGGSGSYTMIQPAIEDAVNGDTVLVNDGTYDESIDFKGKAITVKSVNGREVTTITGSNVCYLPASHNCTVKFNSSETNDSVLDGFTITTRRTVPCYTYSSLIYCSGSSPTIKNCIVTGNKVEYDFYGAIVATASAVSAPVIEDCIIRDNQSAGILSNFGTDVDHIKITRCTITNNSGGGISVHCGTITDCNIYNNDNTGTFLGGGIKANDDYPTTVTGCNIYNNSSDSGGGVYLPGNNSSITNCIITDNTADWGGGVYLSGDNSSITNCIISNNSADGAGGGINLYCNNSTITNCIITYNTATWGGGIRNRGVIAALITNCTIANNSADFSGAIHDGISYTIKNSIIWSNSARFKFDEIYSLSASSIIIEYSDINISGIDLPPGALSTSDCIDTDPLFEDPENGDYHLTPLSPCIDTGTDEGAPADDIDGDLRPIGPGYDMGADEAWMTFYNDSDGDGYGDSSDTGVKSPTYTGFETGYALNNNSDCNDNDSGTNPGITEIADDGIDQDCNGYDLVTFYADFDGDGYGDPFNILQINGPLPPTYAYTDNTDDCDDSDASIYPGATEICGDGIDQDCDGADQVCDNSEIYTGDDTTTDTATPSGEGAGGGGGCFIAEASYEDANKPSVTKWIIDAIIR